MATLGGREALLPDPAYYLGVLAPLPMPCRPFSRINPNRAGDEKPCLECQSFELPVGTTF